MPLSAAVPGQSKISGGKKALGGASKKKKKDGTSKNAVAGPPAKKIERKSKRSLRRVSSIALSGKVAEIINPLVLNWNGRGLMEAPRMMLGDRNFIQMFARF